MANVEINDLTNKATPVSSDEFEIQETAGGASRKATLGAVVSQLLDNEYIRQDGQNDYESLLKGWVTVTFSAGTPSIADDYNVATITDLTTGNTAVNLDILLSTSSTNSVGLAGFLSVAPAAPQGSNIQSVFSDSDSCTVITVNASGTSTDYSFIAMFAGTV